MAERKKEGTALTQGALWGTHSSDWAEQEERHRPLFEEGIRLTGVGGGSSVLDLGCGSGLFCRLAAEMGAAVSGIDASPALIEIAKTRVPKGEFEVGDIQFLPYPENHFDVVTAFNAVQYAADPAAALTEAKRVARPGSPVFALVWGREEHTEMVVLLRALGPLMPPAPPDAPGPFALAYEGALESLFDRAGLGTKDAGYLEAAFEYPDEETLMRLVFASGPAVVATRTSGEDAVRKAVSTAFARFRTSSGTYRIETEWRYVLGSA